MKKLYIIRHAKSSWKDTSLGDYDRPLNKRGKKDAPFMAKVLKEKNISPDAIISSPAKRAKTTAQIFAKEINFTKPVVYNKNIYEADGAELKHVITLLKDKVKTVFIFGHNPGLNMLVENFLEFDENIPTCGIVELEFDCKKWSEISSKNVKLISFDYPKKHNP
ncbi:phosphohistidine phosphatase [Epsilonproteobacteria bacterium SCGC AD-308-O04]|nr:phosphohistidine phosphatase [Epsilonproteobacteria bacterium SCGC AD-308-O04]